MTAKDIRKKEFEKVKFGYQPEEVEAFLKKVETEFRRLEEELADANSKMMTLADKVREYKEGEEDLKNALLGAQKQARQVIEDAKEKAAQIEADARASAESVHSAAMEEQSQQLQNISAQLDKENRVLVETQRQVAAFKKTLFDLYKAHLEQISNLPDTIDEELDDAEVVDAEIVSEEPEAADAASLDDQTPAADSFDAVTFSEPKKPISRTAEFDTRYQDLKFGNRRDEKKKRT